MARLKARAERFVLGIRGLSPWRLWAWSVTGLLLVLALIAVIVQPEAMWPNLAAEAAGLAFTIIVVERIAARQGEEREKRDLILQMGSPNNAFAREAVRRLGAREWLKDGSIRKAVLSGADLHGEELEGADLRDANLRGAILWGANLLHAILRDADLRDADLRYAKLVHAILQDTNMWGADLWCADLRFANLRHAVLQGADLRCADLRRADLRGANLRGTVLRDAILRYAKLKDANLEGVDLFGADLHGAQVTDEQLAQVKTLEGATMPDGAKYTGEPPIEGAASKIDLAKARQRAGLRQKALADQVGVSPLLVYSWEREGTSPSSELRAKVAEVLGVDPWAVRGKHEGDDSWRQQKS